MVKNNYLEDIENALKDKGDPEEVFNIILTFLNFKSVEIGIYRLLLKTSMTIKEMQERLGISERSIRMHIKRLEAEGFITKSVERGIRLKYVYRSVQIQEAWERVDQKIKNILNEVTEAIDS